MEEPLGSSWTGAKHAKECRMAGWLQNKKLKRQEKGN